MKVYFPNLNGLRFIAALLVIVHHEEQIKNYYGLENSWGNPSIRLIGELGVTLFFVLSGFLITFLLFKEKDICKSISIKNFYIRRVLRIWPLYYLLIFLGFFLLPEIKSLYLPYNTPLSSANYYKNLFSYVVFFPHWALIIYGAVPFVGQLWSIGVEEQFYLFWPLIAKYSKLFIRSILIIGLVYLIIKIAISSLHYLSEIGFLGTDVNTINRYRMIVVLSRFDCMAFGGLLAYSHYKSIRFIKILKKPLVLFFIISFTLALLQQGFHVPYFNDEFYTIFFGLIILGLATGRRIFFLENKISSYLGQISYGIYMYHPLSIVISIKIACYLNLTYSVIIYILTIVLTVFIASVSYHFFERPFLNLKYKFSSIESGSK